MFFDYELTNVEEKMLTDIVSKNNVKSNRAKIILLMRGKYRKGFNHVISKQLSLSVTYIMNTVQKFRKKRMGIFETEGPGSGRKQGSVRVNDAKLIDLFEKGMTLSEISNEVGYGISIVSRRFKKLGIKPIRKRKVGSKYKTKKNYYHVTCPNRLISILNEGLKPNEHNEIFLFDNKKDALNIAVNQCIILSDYALLKVKLFEDMLEEDNVAELITGKQYLLKNVAIPKKQIKLVDCYKIFDLVTSNKRAAR